MRLRLLAALAISATCGSCTPAFAQTLSASARAEACHVFKQATGTVYSLAGYAGQAEFIMIFNAPTPPADGAVVPAVAPIYVPAAGTWSWTFSSPAILTGGVTVCASSTGPLSKTAISTNNVFSGQVN